MSAFKHVIWRRCLKSRIVIKFGIDVLLKFCKRHFKQMYLQHLLLRQTLHLLKLLLLGLY